MGDVIPAAEYDYEQNYDNTNDGSHAVRISIASVIAQEFLKSFEPEE